jgi:hypothetical protein
VYTSRYFMQIQAKGQAREATGEEKGEENVK